VTQSNPGTSSLCGNNPPEGIAWSCEPMYDASVARHAHPCALREGQTRREAGAQSLGASYVWEAAGAANRAAKQQRAPSV
jgi:hypothetical protein